MDTIVFDKEIAVCCVPASSFPDGVLAAFQTLHGKLDHKEKRQHFGISHGLADGGIHYLAAATELSPGEAETLGVDRFTIQKGTYLGLTILDYLKDLGEIGRTFHQLLQSPDLDPEGYCLEIYTGKDVQCLVKLKTEPIPLPPKLSQPAQRALANARIKTLEDCCRIREAELAKLHGIGPNALDKIKAAMAEHGLHFAL